MPPVYTTKRQRNALAEAGIEHVKGRKHWDAESLIDECIADNRLPSNIRDRAYDDQLQLLLEMGIEHDPKISKFEASDLIGLNSPPTDRQLEFLSNLDADIPDNLNKKSASDLLDSLTRTLPMSEGQAGLIFNLGGAVVPSMNYRNASKFIDYLRRNELRCRRCNGQHNRRSERCNCGAFIGNGQPLRPERSLLNHRDYPENDSRSFIIRFFEWLQS